jgi:virulence-associated protein VagC
MMQIGLYTQRVTLPQTAALMEQMVQATERSRKVTISPVAEPEGSTPLIPKPATAHDPEPVPSTSHPNLFP